MKIKYKNLKIDFSYSCSELDDDFGSSSMIADNVDLKSFFESLDWTTKDQIDDLYREEEIEIFMDHIFPEDENDELEPFEYLEIKNADLMILFFNWAMQQDADIAFSYEGETPMWLMHDLIHAKYDCSGSNIVVDAYSEERTVFESMKLADELGLIHCFNVQTIIRFDQEFKQRFEQDFPVYRAIKMLNELVNKKEYVI